MVWKDEVNQNEDKNRKLYNGLMQARKSTKSCFGLEKIQVVISRLVL